jgi:hypothetical protein
MPEAQKEGWTYSYSPALGMEIACHQSSGRVYCEDKTKYSPQEVQLMRDTGLTADPLTHAVKRLFGGEIVEARGS